jgi:hypothetical protein
MNIIFLLVIGLAFLAAAFIGATINQYLSYPCSYNQRRILDAAIVFMCVLTVLVVWTLPLWAPTWLS